MIFTDIESYSEADITKVGAYKYSKHPSTEILMTAWAMGGAVAITEHKDLDLLNWMLYSDEVFVAHNANFERLMFKNVWGIDIPIERWIDTQAMGYHCAFAKGLGDMTKAMGLETKMGEGRALINRFSKPAPKSHKADRYDATTHPAEWQQFKDYCVRDVEVTRDLYNKLLPYQATVGREMYDLDSKINDRGVPLDMALVNNSIQAAIDVKTTLKSQMNEITGLANSGSNAQLSDWLGENGCLMKNMQAATVQEAIDSSEEERVRKVLEMKQQVSKTSVTKFQSMSNAQVDGRLHGMFQYGGASRTLRWAGRIVQLQNLARPTVKDLYRLEEMLINCPEMLAYLYEQPVTALSSAIRSAITATAGKLLVVSDLSSIESRILGWLTGCQRIKDIFAKGKDTYKDMATQIFGVPYEAVTKDQRTMAKPVTLGGGYMLGAKGLKAYAEGYGVDMSEEESQKHTTAFRKTYPEIPKFWYWVKDAVFACTEYGATVEGYGLKIYAFGEFLRIRLPSGRCLHYHKPEIREQRMPWGEMGQAFTYMGMDSYRHKWCRISAHPGGVTENIVQAMAKDVLDVWMLRADAEDFNIILHVHDEVGCEEDEDVAEAKLEQLNELIRKPIPWAPGLLLDASGYVAKRYKK